MTHKQQQNRKKSSDDGYMAECLLKIKKAIKSQNKNLFSVSLMFKNLSKYGVGKGNSFCQCAGITSDKDITERGGTTGVLMGGAFSNVNESAMTSSMMGGLCDDDE